MLPRKKLPLRHVALLVVRRGVAEGINPKSCTLTERERERQ